MNDEELLKKLPEVLAALREIVSCNRRRFPRCKGLLRQIDRCDLRSGIFSSMMSFMAEGLPRGDALEAAFDEHAGRRDEMHDLYNDRNWGAEHGFNPLDFAMSWDDDDAPAAVSDECREREENTARCRLGEIERLTDDFFYTFDSRDLPLMMAVLDDQLGFALERELAMIAIVKDHLEAVEEEPPERIEEVFRRVEYFVNNALYGGSK